MEHVIDLESQLSALTQKHKNLKKKYKRMYEDVDIDDETFYNNSQKSKPEPVSDQKQEEIPSPVSQVPTEPSPQPQPQQPKRYGWRARINPMF